jgi:hypothetical protein
MSFWLNGCMVQCMHQLPWFCHRDHLVVLSLASSATADLMLTEEQLLWNPLPHQKDQGSILLLLKCRVGIVVAPKVCYHPPVMLSFLTPSFCCLCEYHRSLAATLNLSCCILIQASSLKRQSRQVACSKHWPHGSSFYVRGGQDTTAKALLCVLAHHAG